MDQEMIDYLEHKSKLPRGTLSKELRERSHSPWISNGTLALCALGITATAALLLAGVYHSPDLQRYLKIRSM